MIVVTGMHRSGTSLVSQLLDQADFGFGSTRLFYPTDQWNVRAYVEAAPIVDLNSLFITGLPRTKSRLHALLSQCVYMTMPDPARIYQRGLKHERDIRQTGKIYDKLAAKDPRFCLTLPLWNRFANIDKVIVCARHPNAVAHSLARRQALPRALSLRFWCYHVRSLLEQLPTYSSFFFDVETLFRGEGLLSFINMLRFLEADLSHIDPERILDTAFQERLMRNHGTSTSRLPGEAQMLWNRMSAAAREAGQTPCGAR